VSAPRARASRGAAARPPAVARSSGALAAPRSRGARAFSLSKSARAGRAKGHFKNARGSRD
jgi:hypothetical protein